MKRALITGINGQLGSYLAELLLEKGYEVHGTVRATSNLQYVDSRVTTHIVAGPNAWPFILERTQPDEVYNLAAASSVSASWETPVESGESAGLDVVRLLEAIRRHRPQARFYQASSSEMFGRSTQPQNESSPLKPHSPYGAAKVYAHTICQVFRESFGLFIATGICFNAESPRRGEQFVTRKIVKAVAAIKRGEQDQLVLGDIAVYRDWGYAKEYAEAMWRTLHIASPLDFVIATGEVHSVGDFCGAAFDRAGLDWTRHVQHSDRGLRRPSEVDVLMGDATRLKVSATWPGPQISFRELVNLMVDAELAR